MLLIFEGSSVAAISIENAPPVVWVVAGAFYLVSLCLSLLALRPRTWTDPQSRVLESFTIRNIEDDHD